MLCTVYGPDLERHVTLARKGSFYMPYNNKQFTSRRFPKPGDSAREFRRPPRVRATIRDGISHSLEWQPAKFIRLRAAGTSASDSFAPPASQYSFFDRFCFFSSTLGGPPRRSRRRTGEISNCIHSSGLSFSTEGEVAAYFLASACARFRIIFASY